MATTNQKRNKEKHISSPIRASSSSSVTIHGLNINTVISPSDFGNLDFTSSYNSKKNQKIKIKSGNFVNIKIRASPLREIKPKANATIQFNVENKEIKVNRNKLAKIAPDFEARFQKGNFYTISNISSQVFQAMLNYLTNEKIDEEEIKKNATGLLTASDKFRLKTLKTLCEKFLVESLSPESAVDLLNLANAHKAEELKSATIQFLKNHPKILESDKFKELLATSSGLAYELYKSIAAVDAKTETKKRKSTATNGKEKTNFLVVRRTSLSSKRMKNLNIDE